MATFRASTATAPCCRTRASASTWSTAAAVGTAPQAGTARPSSTGSRQLRSGHPRPARHRAAPNADRTLTTTGLSQNPDAAAQHWTAIGKGEFLEQGGQDRLVFDGRCNLFTTIDPSVAYNRLPWYLAPALQQSLLYAGVGVLLLGLLAFPAIAVIRRLRKRPAHSRVARVARVAASHLVVAVTYKMVGTPYA